MFKASEKNFVNEPLSVDRRQERYEKLKSVLAEVAGRLNENFKKEMGGGKVGMLLDDECRINAKAFLQGRRQGPYTEAEINDDQARVLDKETNEFGIDTTNENVIDYYKTLGAESEEEIIVEHQKEKKRANWHLLEMATPVLLYKFLPKNFVAVKTTAYDDYENGVDNLIVDKSTGEVICTVDDFSALAGSKHDLSKQEKVLNKTKHGGAKLRYGITYDDKGKLVKGPLRNLPVFNFRLSADALKGLLREMNFDLDREPSIKEREVVMQIIQDFIEQTKILLESEINDDMKEKINRFQTILANWTASLRGGKLNSHFFRVASR